MHKFVYGMVFVPYFASLLLLGVACVLSLCTISIAESATIQASDLNLVPFPKHCTMYSGWFALKSKMTISVSANPVCKQAAEDLKEELYGVAGVQCEVKAAKTQNTDTMVSLILSAGPVEGIIGKPSDIPAQEEGYYLSVSPKMVVAKAKNAKGLAHATQTLRQLVRANTQKRSIPALTITDYPSLRYRGFQDDITRGISSKLSLLKFEVETCSFLKMNFLTYYMENQYEFKKHPSIGPKDGSLTPSDLKALVKYAEPRGVEIIGCQQSFGHMQNILAHEEYKDLRETNAILDPTSEKTYQLLDDLYSEQVPLLPSKFFNVCCDETQGLGTGPSKTLVDKIGVGGVYTAHMKRVHDILKDKYGKRMMMWGDIILGHPENLSDIPKDTVMLSWGYEPSDSFESAILPFSKSGYDFFVCPGMQCWDRILPDYGISVVNIHNYVRDGAKLGAMGMLNTSWDDHGDNLMGYNWYLVAWGAECAWNASATSVEDFNRRIGRVLYGESSNHFGKAIELIIRARENNRYWDYWRMPDTRFFLVNNSDSSPMLEYGPTVEDRQKAKADSQALLDLVVPALNELHTAQKEAKVNASQLDFVIFGADRMKLMASRTIDMLKASDLYSEAFLCPDPVRSEFLISVAIDQVNRVRDEHVIMKERNRELWNRENRPYALSTVMGRYDILLKRYDDNIAALKNAVKYLKSGKPIPPATEVGL